MKLSDYIADFLSKITDAVFVGQGGNIIHVLDSLGKKKILRLFHRKMNKEFQLLLTPTLDLVIKLVNCSHKGPGMLNLMQGMVCSFFDSIQHFTFQAQL